ncbi:MAG: ATP-dependent zinc metalloprotease FtsH [Planctomycetota bacterium]|nr:ATP-dependent zinc metalloprotease FtsH [Planctomycetota bacterium]
MAEDPNVPSDPNARKGKSFASFLLFLTLLVAILAYVGGQELSAPKKLSQDQYLHDLHLGRIERQEFRGDRVTGRITDGTPDGAAFEVRFHNLDEREREFRDLKAQRPPRPIATSLFDKAVKAGDYTPRAARLIIANDEEIERSEGTAVASISRPSQEVTTLVHVYTKGQRNGSTKSYYMPKEPSSIWLNIEGIDDLAAFTGTLSELGIIAEDLPFDLSEERGSTSAEDSNLMQSLFFVYGPFILVVLFIVFYMRHLRSQGGAGGMMNFGKSRAKLYQKENHTNVTFNDVAGVEEAKDEVREVVEFLKNPGRFTRIGGRIPRGILLVGTPGCGKTLLAKAIAGEAEVPFYAISGSDFVEMFVGVGASRVRDLFKTARENSPCILFLDEIDAVGRRRGSGMGGGHDEREQTLNAILVEMDGFGTDEGIIVLAASNRPDVLDPALLRPGRFDREVVIDLPDVKGREAILKVHLKKVKHAEDIDTISLARSTPGYSGADLAAAVNEAAIMAALQKCEEIKQEHLDEARDKVRYGRQKKSRKMEEVDREITAYHEAGHTVVAAKLENTDRPHKVTIVPRGRALGSTMILPDKESYHMQKKRLKSQLAVLFGGRIAEDIFCGDISAGASDDIKRATDLARAMVSELGMSTKIGPINYAERQGSDFLGTELMASRFHSEETTREIDEEVKLLLKEAYELAESVITEHHDEIKQLVVGLMRFETLSSDEIDKLLDGVPVDDIRVEEDLIEPAPIEVPGATEEPSSNEEVPNADGLTGDLPGEPGLSPA